MGLSSYEIRREANILKNKALLASLDVQVDAVPSKILSKESPSRIRKSSQVANPTSPPHKRVKISPGIEHTSQTSLRRSSRNSGKERLDYAVATFPKRASMPITDTEKRRLESNGINSLASSENAGNCLGKRTHDPKTFGHIPGIAIGTWWETRAHCSTDAVHAPFVAGISGDSQKGAYSVALSGGYDDDVDLGYAFTFTGCGGRDLKGTAQKPKNLRTAPQSSDQTFDNHFNQSLLVSSKTGKPVRVIRGYKLQSLYAPLEGYRYDGLYKVEKAWTEKGLNEKGYLVCKFAFTRLAGQPPLPMRPDSERETSSAE